ncbi:hypothetical protein [uncultured Microbulbifer sp.]|nr:hypothetical protein [uncultured Microbulbifer sp.]
MKEITKYELEAISGGFDRFHKLWNPTHDQDPNEIAELWEEWNRLHGGF